MPDIYEPTVQPSQQNKEQHALRVAQDLYGQDPEWVIYFREVLGVGGVVSQLFGDSEELEAFKQTRAHEEIQRMLSELRQRAPAKQEDDKEPQRVITVRLPKSLHESLRAEAHALRTSMNKLCISKLLQAIDEQMLAGDVVNGQEPEQQNR